jgi:hypothetical protein
MNEQPPVLVALADSERSSGFQRALFRFAAVLGEARELNDDERKTFADVAARAFARSLGPDLAVVEAESITRAAAT